MKKFPILLTFLLLSGCAGNFSDSNITLSLGEKRALDVAEQASLGYSTDPISLSHRKLDLHEIAGHLDMDEETAKLHLKATNVHGYYSLIANNYPPGMEFILYHIDYERKVNASKTFFVNGNGMLITPMDTTYVELESNFLSFSNYLPGEPIDFVLGSKDGKYFAATRIVPNPIMLKDRSGHLVSVEIASPDRKKYIVSGIGFEPFGSYMLITQFENERLVHTLQADENGEMFQLTGPTIPWVTGGEASIELRGDGIDNLITFEFQWGQ